MITALVLAGIAPPTLFRICPLPSALKNLLVNHKNSLGDYVGDHVNCGGVKCSKQRPSDITIQISSKNGGPFYAAAVAAPLERVRRG